MKTSRWKILVTICIIACLILPSSVFATYVPSNGDEIYLLGWNGATAPDSEQKYLQGHGTGYTCTLGTCNPNNSQWTTIHLYSGYWILKNVASPYECVTRASAMQTNGYYNCIGRPYNETGVGDRQKIVIYANGYINLYTQSAYNMQADKQNVSTSSDVIFYNLGTGNRLYWLIHVVDSV